MVGGGSTGTSVAYHLTKLGYGRILLAEKGTIGGGQTGKSTGVVRLHYSIPETAKMALYSFRFMERWESEVGGRCGLTKCGFMIVASEREADSLKRAVELQRSIGINTRIISPEEIREIEPRMNVSDVAAAAYEPDSGYADPMDTSISFAEAARRMGAEVREHAEVEVFKTEGDMIAAARVAGEWVEADSYVIAVGVWANRLLSKLGRSLPLRIGVEEVAAIMRPEKFRGLHLVLADLINGFYMRPLGDSETHMGSLDPEYPEPEPDPDRVDYESIRRETYHRYMELYSKRFPVMEEAPYKPRGWRGLYDVTPDWQPILGRDEIYRNLYLAVGLSGHGFKLSPALGLVVAEAVAKGKSSLVDVELYGVRRFKEGRLIGREYGFGILS